MKKLPARFLVESALIAAAYAALTLAVSPIAYLGTQFRISEALTILPAFTPAAIPGLTVGCFLANLGSPLGPVDWIFGSLATFLAAMSSYWLRRYCFKGVPLLSVFPPIFWNALIVGLELTLLTDGVTFLPMALSVGFGELVICVVLGIPLMIGLGRTPLAGELGKTIRVSGKNKKTGMINMKKTIGVLFADVMEYTPFIKHFSSKIVDRSVKRGNESVLVHLENGGRVLDICAVKCGIGKVNASSAAAFLIGEDQAELILNAGLSGAVKGVSREEIVLGNSYVEVDFDLTPLGFQPGAKPEQDFVYTADSRLLSLASSLIGEFKQGRFGCGDAFLSDPVKKAYYADTFEICAMDMESAAIASVCKKADVPFLSLRKMSDDADGSALDDYHEMNQRAETALSEVLDLLFDKILSDDSYWK